MAIVSLQLTDFRNFATAELQPTQGMNIICGHNGSGKTSLLESIFYLGLGRSFRSASSSRLVRQTTPKFSVFAQILNDSGSLSIGMERSLQGDSKIRLDEKEVSSMMDLIHLLPLRMINSQTHQLFESGPAYRRKYLDWGLFYQYDNFLPVWRNFERSLKQRNVLLKKSASSREINPWTEALAVHGLELHRLRQEYVQIITPFILSLINELLGLPVQITYYPGWDESLTLSEVLAEYFDEERRLGYTQFGPHRADLDFAIDMISVKHYLSRGQQKLLICAMILAQGMLLAHASNKTLIYLIDDLPSELDLHSRQKLISLLSKQSAQVFLTAIENEELERLLQAYPNVTSKLFHVEHGKVKEKY